MVQCNRIEFLETQIVEALDLSDASLELEQPGASVAAKKLAAELRAELDKLKAFELEQGLKRTPLEQARAMRQRADAAGSHIAAHKYFELELELDAAEEARRVEEERRRLAHMGLDERIARLASVLLALPPEVREQVRSAVFDPVH